MVTKGEGEEEGKIRSEDLQIYITVYQINNKNLL